jgi:glycerophosphoryl diester phosphodiesterase
MQNGSASARALPAAGLTQEAFPSAAEPLIIGHRGAPGYLPEHSRAGYELALAHGVDALEPDLVASRDGVLVVRHENEISTTTDVASRSEFAGRRTTKEIDGHAVTGWFTEDFTWAELRSLRSIERLPLLRPGSARFDRAFPLMSFAEVLALHSWAQDGHAAPIRLVAEFKHATYFASIGLPLDELFADELGRSDLGQHSEDLLVIESFEKDLLRELRSRGVAAKYVYNVHAAGAPFDVQAVDGAGATTYAEELSDSGLASLRGLGDGPGAGIDGISIDKAIVLDPSAAEHADVVARAHRIGLEVFCWTFRPENAFLSPSHRRGEPEEFGDWRGELQRLKAAGVDGIFVDHPDLARPRAAAGDGSQ